MSSLSKSLSNLPIFYGWVILAIATIVMFASGPGQTYGFSIFIDPIIQETGWSRSMVSTLYSTASLTASLALILVGKLLDKYGAQVILMGVAILFGFGATLMSQVASPIHLFAGFTIMRLLGQGALILISAVLIAQWFIRLRGRAMGIIALGTSTSLALYPLVIHFFISEIGWRSTWIIIAIVTWALLLLPAILARRTPESIGTYPDGDTQPSSQDQISSIQDTNYTNEVSYTLREALHTKSFWLLIIAVSGQPLVNTALQFHQVSLIAEKGLNPSVGATVFAVYAIVALGGNFFSGLLADKFPNRYILASAQILLVISILSIFTISEQWHALLYGAIFGLSGGMFLTVSAVIWPNYFGRKHIGTITGLTTTIMVASSALGPMPFGILFDMTHSYTTAILIFLALPIICTGLAFAAKPPEKSNHVFPI